LRLLLPGARAWLAQKQPKQRHTYGYRRASILAALFNAGLLLVAVGGIIVEAINRLQEPAAVAAGPLYVAALGILTNGGTRCCFMRGRHGDLNIRGAYLAHGGRCRRLVRGVVAALVIMLTGWLWDRPRDQPRYSSCGARQRLGPGAPTAVNLALDGVPRGIELLKVRDYLGGLEGSRKCTTCTSGP